VLMGLVLGHSRRRICSQIDIGLFCDFMPLTTSTGVCFVVGLLCIMLRVFGSTPAA